MSLHPAPCRLAAAGTPPPTERQTAREGDRSLREHMDNTHLDPAGPAPPSPADPLHDVRSLGEYRILRRLGEGGMGAVYLGYHEGQSQQVALKVLNDQLASNQGYVDRFYREAKSGALLSHPNIVRTLNVGQDRATAKHYLVLEFVDGPSAHALLDRVGPLPVGDVVHIGLDVARALEHAHSRNVVHRDIKPDNILITRSGVSKLVDLGLARRTDEASHLTAARQGFGTTHYMPYEQAINAKHADGRSDLYALGATLYHLVTGQVPFPGDNHLEVVEKKNFGEFLPASALNPAVPPALDHILARMLARLPRDRYQTASELIIDLERSRLAAPVPSFADPDQARQDPWVQACLASSAEPTRLDPETPPGPPVKLAGADDVWQLRFRNHTGRTVKAQLTTRQILQRLRAGRMPAKVAARRAEKDGYQPLTVYPEFRSVRPARKVRPAPARTPAVTATVPAPAPQSNGEPEPEEAVAPSRWPLLLVAILIAASVAAGGLLLALWILLRS